MHYMITKSSKYSEPVTSNEYFRIDYTPKQIKKEHTLIKSKRERSESEKSIV